MANTLEIGLVEEIGGWGFTLSSLRDQLNGFNGDEIELTINSFGGEYLEGLAIYNYLKSRKEKKRAKILAIAASAGTLVALGADEVVMPENGYFMIHNPWTIAIGDVNDFEDTANVLQKFTDDLVSIYSKRTGMTENKVRKMMDDETWLTAKEAKALGFIDKIEKPISAKASIKPEILAKFKNVPESFITPKNDNVMANSLLDTVKATVKAWFGKDVTTEAEAIKVLESAELPKTENSIYDLEGVRSALTADFEAVRGDIAKVTADFNTAIEKVQNEFKAAIEERDALIFALTDKVTEMTAEQAEDDSEQDAEIDQLKANVKALNEKIANIQAKKSGTTPAKPESVAVETTDPDKAAEEQLRGTVKAKVSATQIVLGNNKKMNFNRH